MKDTFKARLQTQMKRGVHRHRSIKRANSEFVEISLLTLTDPIDTQFEYWQLRADILAMDGDNRKPASLEARMN